MNRRKYFLPVIFISLLLVCRVSSQTTTFTYQGKLTDGGVPASGTYQMSFKLYDAVSGGSQVGSTVADVMATASNGIFTIQLDFGPAAFASGADRYLEIAVRPTASAPVGGA